MRAHKQRIPSRFTTETLTRARTSDAPVRITQAPFKQPRPVARAPSLTVPTRPEAALTRIDPQLLALYPTLDQIPESLRLNPNDNPPVSLIGGKVELARNSNPVYSKIAVREGTELKPVLIGYEPVVTAADARRATELASETAKRGEWSKKSTEERIKAVESFLTHDLEANADRYAALAMYSVCKTLPDAKKEVQRTVEYMRETIKELRNIEAVTQSTMGSTQHVRNLVRGSGLTLCVGPYNYPINEALTLALPFLLRGDCVILKTARMDMSIQAMIDGFAKHFPPGTITVLPGDGRVVLPAVMSAAEYDSDGKVKRGLIDRFAFIGSKKAADAIIAQHPKREQLGTPLLGLGAKNAAVILPSADVKQAAKQAGKGALSNNGQRCTSEKIHFVHRSVAAEYVEALREVVGQYKLGMGYEPGVTHGPLPEDGKIAAMHEYLDDATLRPERAAKIINPRGGTAYHSVMTPAIVFPVTKEMRLWHEEQFGPIIPVAIYDDLSEVYEWQESSPYGQQIGIWGNADEATPLVDKLVDEKLVARININDVCQRGNDDIGFTAFKQGSATVSIRDTLLWETQIVRVQAPKREDLEKASRAS